MIRSAPGCLFALLAIISLAACSPPLPEEKRIAQSIVKMQQAADKRDLADVMQHIHPSFLGKKNMRKRQLQGHFYFHFQINPRIRVYISNLNIVVEGEDAEVSCHLLVTGSHTKIPDWGQLYRIRSGWKKFGKDWQVVEAEWEDVVEELQQ